MPVEISTMAERCGRAPCQVNHASPNGFGFGGKRRAIIVIFPFLGKVTADLRLAGGAAEPV